MDVFYALAEPTRRNIVELLAHYGQLGASDIAAKFTITPQAISQHLKVLREAHLVKVEKHAQQRLYQINPEAVTELEEWAKQLRRQWSERFDALDDLLEKEKAKSKS